MQNIHFHYTVYTYNVYIIYYVMYVYTAELQKNGTYIKFIWQTFKRKGWQVNIFEVLTCLATTENRERRRLPLERRFQCG